VPAGKLFDLDPPLGAFDLAGQVFRQPSDVEFLALANGCSLRVHL
jgi:hypothetical protein